MWMERKTGRAEAGTATIPSEPLLRLCLKQKQLAPGGKRSKSLDEPEEKRLNPQTSKHPPGRDSAEPSESPGGPRGCRRHPRGYGTC